MHRVEWAWRRRAFGSLKDFFLYGSMLSESTTTIFDHPHRPPLDPERVARALNYTVERIGHGEYRVRGSAEDYFVTLLPYYDCPCGDAVFRETICKHQIAALLFERDHEAVRIALSIQGECESGASMRVAKKTRRRLGDDPFGLSYDRSCAAQDGGRLVSDESNNGSADEVELQPAERIVISRW